MIARQEDVAVIIVLFAADWVPRISRSQQEARLLQPKCMQQDIWTYKRCVIQPAEINEY